MAKNKTKQNETHPKFTFTPCKERELLLNWTEQHLSELVNPINIDDNIKGMNNIYNYALIYMDKEKIYKEQNKSYLLIFYHFIRLIEDIAESRKK